MCRLKTDIYYQTLSFHGNDLEDAMPVNEEIFSSLFDYIVKEEPGKTAQPHLIVGESGSGKTYLLKRLQDKVGKETSTVFPILIDAKALFSTEDIWLHCVRQLELTVSSADGFDDIMLWQKTHARRVVLLIDNIQYYFNRTDNAAHYNLRGKLNKPGAPVLIATINEVSAFVTDYKAAFFDGFKTLYIRPINTDETVIAFKQSFDKNIFDFLWKYVPKTIRSLRIISSILKESSNMDTALIKLIDCFYPYYQNKYDSYPLQIQRLLSVLATSDDGMSLRDIREKTKQDNGKISPYLKIMTDQKLIERISKTQRGAKYKIVDSLFSLWLKLNVAVIF